MDEKGVVTAKKKGNVKITATVAGTTVICNITVKKSERKNLEKYSKFKVNAPANSMRPVTIKIKKSKITKKTTDLRNGKITIKVGGGILYQ